MKNLLTYSLILFSILLFSFTQFNGIINALKKGSASQLSQYFDKTVNITLPSKGSTFSKSQAELVLKDFFDNNGVKSFEIVQQKNTNQLHYIVGTLLTNSGEFKTTIYIKQKVDKQFLQEIRFEK